MEEQYYYDITGEIRELEDIIEDVANDYGINPSILNL